MESRHEQVRDSAVHPTSIRFSAERTVRYDTYLFNLQPHMHVRGKHISYTAVFPDGREQKLLSIPNYQFNWQMIYTPTEPIFLPKGTKMVLEGAFDNSAMNLTNPDPSQEVKFGPQSWDEMFIGHTQIAAPARNRRSKGLAPTSIVLFRRPTCLKSAPNLVPHGLRGNGSVCRSAARALPSAERTRHAYPRGAWVRGRGWARARVFELESRVSIPPACRSARS